MGLPWGDAPKTAVGVLVLASAAAVGHAEEGEELEHVSKANLGISVMLLGSIAFMMSLFYLTNLKDPELRKYSWKVISATISIFSAVLLFQAFNGLLEHFFLTGASKEFELLVACCHFMAWFAILQMALAVISGAVGGGKERAEEDMWAMEVNLQCFATLLGHITGFAAINTFAVLQQVVPRNGVSLFLCGPFAWTCVWMLGRFTDGVRDAVALGDDGKVDECEEKWDEATEETEDDVVGLCVSFVTVQWLRFCISGQLPNEEGEEPESMLSSHSNGEVVALFMAGIIVEFVHAYKTLYFQPWSSQRFTPQMRNVTAMIFAWCFFFSSDWWISATFFTEEHGMIKQVVLAMFVTFWSLALIFVLDKVEEAYSEDSKMESAIRSMILALSILIGFGWERAFDTAVADTTEQVEGVPHAFTKMVLAVLLTGIVIPAWKMHVLPTIMALEAAEEGHGQHHDEEHAEEARDSLPALQQPLLDADGLLLSRKPSEVEKRYQDLLLQVDDLKVKAAEADELRRRNADLEGTVLGISSELGELQKLATLLSS